MAKNKLTKFAEMETFDNVFQCAAREANADNPVVSMSGHWHENYFHNNHPIVLEFGGQQNSRWKREKVKQIIRQKVGTIIDSLPNAKIVVLGDMNASPAEDLLPLHNLMLQFPSTEGTHKYQSVWTCLDQFYISESLQNRSSVIIFSAPWLQEEDARYLDTRPKRTFIGFQYNRNGYSDHLPILLRL